MSFLIPNRNPIPTRLPSVQDHQVDFKMYAHQYRPRCTTLAVAITSSDATEWTFGDTTFMMSHDLLRVYDSDTGNTEDIQIDGEPTGPTTANVIRGVAGTTPQAAYATDTTTVTLIANSRSGGEVHDSTVRFIESRQSRPFRVVPASS